MTNQELREELTRLGVEFPRNAKKAELEALLEENIIEDEKEEAGDMVEVFEGLVEENGEFRLYEKGDEFSIYRVMEGKEVLLSTGEEIATRKLFKELVKSV